MKGAVRADKGVPSWNNGEHMMTKLLETGARQVLRICLGFLRQGTLPGLDRTRLRQKQKIWTRFATSRDDSAGNQSHTKSRQQSRFIRRRSSGQAEPCADRAIHSSLQVEVRGHSYKDRPVLLPQRGESSAVTPHHAQ